MQSDTIKLVFTYTIAAIVIVGGGYLLFVARNDVDPNGFSLVIAGFIGAAVAFVFGQESATRAARSSEKAHEAGVYAGLTTPQTMGVPEAFEDEYDPTADEPENEDPAVAAAVPVEHRA